jgi:hypothetical protein
MCFASVLNVVSSLLASNTSSDQLTILSQDRHPWQPKFFAGQLIPNCVRSRNIATLETIGYRVTAKNPVLSSRGEVNDESVENTVTT